MTELRIRIEGLKVKIGLYGVSRSGKNFLIDKTLQLTAGIKHIPGSATLGKLSNEMYGCEFAGLTNSMKESVRLEFAKIVHKEGLHIKNIVVDGHYSFPKEDGAGYDVVFTEADEGLYDVFIYLDTPSERISKNASRSEPGRKNTLCDVGGIDAWKSFEIAGLREICSRLGKELVVLDGNVEICCDFLLQLTRNPELFLPCKIVSRVIHDNKAALDNHHTVLLLDCDRTITLNDTTFDFCEFAYVDTAALREIYKGEYYTIYQSFRAKKLFESISPKLYFEACMYAAGKGIVNERLVADVRAGSFGVLVIGITSGIVDIWTHILRGLDLPCILIGNGTRLSGSYLVSSFAKRMLASALRKMGKKVIAVGDSMIDVQMLEQADAGFVSAGQKLNAGVEKYLLSQEGRTQIRQLGYNTFKYRGIREAGSIWE